MRNNLKVQRFDKSTCCAEVFHKINHVSVASFMATYLEIARYKTLHEVELATLDLIHYCKCVHEKNATFFLRETFTF